MATTNLLLMVDKYIQRPVDRADRAIAASPSPIVTNKPSQLTAPAGLLGNNLNRLINLPIGLLRQSQKPQQYLQELMHGVHHLSLSDHLFKWRCQKLVTLVSMIASLDLTDLKRELKLQKSWRTVPSPTPSWQIPLKSWFQWEIKWVPSHGALRHTRSLLSRLKCQSTLGITPMRLSSACSSKLMEWWSPRPSSKWSENIRASPLSTRLFLMTIPCSPWEDLILERWTSRFPSTRLR